MMRRALSLLALSFASIAPALAEPPLLTLTPALATWQDPIHLSITGSWLGCGLPFTVGAPFVQTIAPLRHRLTLQLAQICPPGPPISLQPIAIEQDLGRLAAGVYDVTLLDASRNTIAVSSLDVYEVGVDRVTIAAPVTDDAPVPIHVDAVGYNIVGIGALPGNELVLNISSCTIPFPILPPPPPPLRLLSVDMPWPALAAGDYDLLVFDGCGLPSEGNIPPPRMPGLTRVPFRVWRSDRCVPADDVLCLQDGRFRVTGSWRAFDGSTGIAHAAPLAGNHGSGLLWFFDAANPEMTVKLVDGCALDRAWWVFLAAGSNVEYTIAVRDTLTGAEKTYRNALGALPPLVADTSAFATCP